MGTQVGAILDGKVTGITKFGAFVALDGGGSGLVHISEVANAYVNDIKDYLTVGQTVKVRVLSIDENGRINLSVKKAAPGSAAPKGGAENARVQTSVRVAPGQVEQPAENSDFENRLKKFMQESDSRISDNRIYADHRSRRRRK